MSFNITLYDNSIFKTVFESISRIIDEVTLILDNQGLHISALDKSHITFITLELKKELFDEYSLETPEKINIDCNEFMKILKKCKNNDTLKLGLDEGNLIILFEGDASREFKLRLIDNEYETITPPEINHECNIQIATNVLKDAIDDMGLFGETLRFIIDQDYFIIRSGDDAGFGDACTKYIHGENVQSSVAASYTIGKLVDIMKSSKFSDSVTVGLGDDLPLLLRLELSTGDGVLEFLLAPRISDDDGGV